MSDNPKFTYLTDVSLNFLSDDEKHNHINLDDFSRGRYNYTFKTSKGMERNDVNIELEYDWPTDHYALGSWQRIMTFDDVIKIIRKGKVLHWSGKDEKDFSLHLTFNCKDISQGRISGTGKRIGRISPAFWITTKVKDGEYDGEYIPKTIRDNMPDDEGREYYLDCSKRKLAGELLAELRVGSYRETSNSSNDVRDVSIGLYISVLRSLMSRLYEISECSDENKAEMKTGEYQTDDKDLKSFANSKINLQKLVDKINKELAHNDHLTIKFHHLWKSMAEARYGRNSHTFTVKKEGKEQEYSIVFGTYYRQVCRIREDERDNAKKIELSTYHLIDYIEDFIHTFFSDDSNNKNIENYLSIDFPVYADQYSISLPQNRNTRILEQMLRKTKENFTDECISSFESQLLQLGLISDDVPVEIVDKFSIKKGPSLSFTFRADMEDFNFEQWAKEHIRKFNIIFQKRTSEQLNSIDILSDRNIITPYSENDLTEKAVCEFVDTYKNDSMMIWPTHPRKHNFWQDGAAYAPFYLIEDQSESISWNIEKIEVRISDYMEDKEKDILFYRVQIVFVPKIEIINPDKIYRLLFRAIPRPKAARH